MPSPREFLERLLERSDLSQVEAEELLTHLTNPEGSHAMAGAILAALRTKGAVADEGQGGHANVDACMSEHACGQAVDGSETAVRSALGGRGRTAAAGERGADGEREQAR